ncbi:MAG: ADP-glyceromanno-heptose 6-epimerase [Victivallaceae bacterium]|nr:ADP-glyceromanno-heptose 6-epimerase [Victivallaceae bacterium]
MLIVTGGAGLIGGAVVQEFNRAGVDDILVVDHLGESPEKWKNLRALRMSDYLEKDDFRKKLAAGYFAPGEIDGIIHLGACSSTTESDASYLIDNNYHATQEVAEYAVKNGIFLVYASSCATYGGGEEGYADDESRIERLRPLNMYGCSKQLFDLWARRRGYFKGIAGCKFSNVYGPNEFHKNSMRSVILRAYEQITATGRMQLFRSYREEYADGEQKRDFLYVKDAARMVKMLYDKKCPGLFNIGSGVAETWNSLIRSAFAALGKPAAIDYIDMPETLRGKYQYYTCAEMDKFRAAVGEYSLFSSADAVKDYCRYLTAGKLLGDLPDRELQCRPK